MDVNNQAPAENTEAAPQTADIDSFSEFKFQGQSYTPEKLSGIFNEHKQWGEQIKSQSSYDDYLKNVAIDLETVLKDPSLADQFKETYPKAFHGLLERFLSQNRPDASNGNPQNGLPKEFSEKFSAIESKLNRYERATHQAEVARQEAYLKTTVDPMFAKYEFSDTDAVYAKAQSLVDQGYKMTDSAWERLIKENHLANQKKFERIREKELKTQIENGKKGADTGAGGSAPGQAPARPRTFAEADDMALKHFKGR